MVQKYMVRIPWGEKDPHGSAYGEAVPSSTVALLVEGFKEEALVRKLRLVGFKQPKHSLKLT